MRLFVILMVFKSTDLTNRSNAFLSVSIGLDGGGPPVLLMSMSYYLSLISAISELSS